MDIQTAQPEDTKLIPWWSVLLAVLAFLGWQALVHMVFVPNDPKPKPMAFVVVWGIMVGLFFAFYMIMVGYVNQDARRRGMSASLWTAIMLLLLVSGIGFIVYFLVRQPIVVKCPRCRERVEADFNFCPKCDQQLHPTCQVCKKAVRPGDTFCAHCGGALAAA